MSEVLVLDDDEVTRRLFQNVVSSWSGRDVEGALACMHDDIVYENNVDGKLAPFAATSQGKSDLRRKLRLLLDTFAFNAYVTDHLAVCGNTARARMKIIFTHLETGERLKTNFSFIVEQREGLLTRIEECHDADYIEAFLRFVATLRPA